MPLNPLFNVAPGVYQTTPQVSAPLLRVGEQQQVWLNQNITAGTTTSIAVQVEWIKSGFFYVPKLAVELSASATPGTFEVDVQFAETDLDKYYVSSSTVINAMNSATNNVGRWDLPAGFFPRFVRLFAKTWTNAVTASAIITH